MAQYSHQAFIFLTLVAGGTERRSQATLVLRDGAFHMPAIPIDASVKPAFHLSPIKPFGPLSPSSLVQGNHCRSNSQFLASEPMIVFGVVPGIGQQAVNRQVTARLPHGVGKLGRVLAGAVGDHGGREQIRFGVTDEREFRPTTSQKSLVSNPVDVVSRGMATLQSRSVDHRFGPFLDQATRSRSIENGGEQFVESPFFRSRS